MRYTGPKKKLCRREQKNLFGPAKYDIWRQTKLPWQQSKMWGRLSEYWLLLRNKQSLRRMYGLSEKQFYRIVMNISKKYAKNHEIGHDGAVMMFLESRLDTVLLRSWYAETIMQARQMITHSHRKLNNRKHNIPSYIMQPWDTLSLKDALHTSGLYEDKPDNKTTQPTRLNVNKNKHTIEMLDTPGYEEDTLWGVDVLKVIEFYARV